MKQRICIETVNGVVRSEENEKVSLKDLLNFQKITKENFSKISYISLEIGGYERIFNKDNIVSIWIESVE